MSTLTNTPQIDEDKLREVTVVRMSMMIMIKISMMIMEEAAAAEEELPSQEV